jgi:hypothetical protein
MDGISQYSASRGSSSRRPGDTVRMRRVAAVHCHVPYFVERRLEVQLGRGLEGGHIPTTGQHLSWAASGGPPAVPLAGRCAPRCADPGSLHSDAHWMMAGCQGRREAGALPAKTVLAQGASVRVTAAGVPGAPPFCLRAVGSSPAPLCCGSHPVVRGACRRGPARRFQRQGSRNQHHRSCSSRCRRRTKCRGNSAARTQVATCTHARGQR